MPFSDEERRALLAVRGVGPTVVTRLEQMGFESLAQLRDASVEEIVSAGAEIVGSTCWKNSPQARAAIRSIAEIYRYAVSLARAKDLSSRHLVRGPNRLEVKLTWR